MSTVQTTRRWTIDRSRSVVEFSVEGFLGLGTISGRFERFDGTYTVGPAGSTLDLTLDATSIDTGAGFLDQRLRSLVGGRSQARFTSTRIVDAGDGSVRVSGVAGAGGKTREVSFLATIRELDDELELESTTTVDRPRATVHIRARFRPAG